MPVLLDLPLRDRALGAEAVNLLHQPFDVVQGSVRVHEDQTQIASVSELGRGDVEIARRQNAFAQIELARIGALDPETEDVRLGRDGHLDPVEPFQVVVGSRGQAVLPLDVARQSRFPQRGEHAVEAEAQAALGAFHSPVEKIESRLLLVVKQIARLLLEGRVDSPVIPHQQGGADRGGPHHLVGIPGQGTGQLHPIQPMTVIGRQQGGSSVGAVHMEPEVLILTELAEGTEPVVDPDRRAAGIGDQGQGRFAISAQAREGGRQRARVHDAARVGGDVIEIARPQPQNADRAFDAVMVGVRRHYREVARVPLSPGVGADRSPRRDQGRQVGQRPTVGQDTPTEGPLGLPFWLQRRRRPTDLFQHPVDDEVFDGGGARTHFVDRHGIVGQPIDQRPHGGGVMRDGHLVAQVAGLVQVDDRLQIAVHEPPERLALQSTVAREPVELQILDDGGHRALRQHRRRPRPRPCEVPVQGVGDERQIR